MKSFIHHPSQLVSEYDLLAELSREAKTVCDEAVRFRSRADIPGYFLHSPADASYALRQVGFPRVLHYAWHESWRDSSLISDQKHRIIDGLEIALELDAVHSALFVGASPTFGDEAVFGAWACFHKSHDDLFVIAMQSTTYASEYLWFFQGSLPFYLTPDRFGRRARLDDPEEKRTRNRVMTSLQDKVMLHQLGKAYYSALGKGIVR